MAVLVSAAAVAFSSIGAAVVPDGSPIGVASHVACSEIGRVPRPVDHCALWTYRYLGEGLRDDRILGLVTSADGRMLYAVGQSERASGGSQALVLALDATLGLPIWEATWEGAAGLYDLFSELVLSPDGRTLYAVGFTERAPDNYDALVAAFDTSSGALLWATTYDGAAGMNDTAYELVLDGEGSVLYVGGSTREHGPHADYLVLAIDAATGSVVWSWSHDGPGRDSDSLVAIAVDPGGERLYVTGHVRQPDGGWDVRTFSLNASTGAERWRSTFEWPRDFDFASALVVSPDGSWIRVIAEIATPGRGLDVHTIAYDAFSGAQQWVAVYDGGLNTPDTVGAARLSPDGSRLYVTGGQAAGHQRLFVLAMDPANGAPQWVQHVEHPLDPIGGGYLDVARDGSVLAVAGVSSWFDVPPDVTDEWDLLTFVFDAADGQLLWSARYNGPLSETDVPRALVLAPVGKRLFAAGYSDIADSLKGVASGADGLVLAYDPIILETA